MNVILLNGPMGVGKTTIGTYIADKFNGTAFIDGDWCMDLHPFVGNDETKELAIDNILHMIRNYKECSYCNMVVIAWLMDDEWVIKKLIDGINELDCDAKNITLVSSEMQLREQWMNDKNCPWRTEEWLDISIKSLDKFSKMKEAIDITNLSIKEVANLVIKKCQLDN